MQWNGIYHCTERNGHGTDTEHELFLPSVYWTFCCTSCYVYHIKINCLWVTTIIIWFRLDHFSTCKKIFSASKFIDGYYCTIENRQRHSFVDILTYSRPSSESWVLQSWTKPWALMILKKAWMNQNVDIAVLFAHWTALMHPWMLLLTCAIISI